MTTVHLGYAGRRLPRPVGQGEFVPARKAGRKIARVVAWHTFPTRWYIGQSGRFASCGSMIMRTNGVTFRYLTFTTKATAESRSSCVNWLLASNSMWPRCRTFTRLAQRSVRDPIALIAGMAEDAGVPCHGWVGGGAAAALECRISPPLDARGLKDQDWTLLSHQRHAEGADGLGGQARDARAQGRERPAR